MGNEEVSPKGENADPTETEDLLEDESLWSDEEGDESDASDETPEGEQQAGSESEAREQQPEPTIDIDGEQVPISRVKEWKQGHESKKELQREFTQRSQELSELKRARYADSTVPPYQPQYPSPYYTQSQQGQNMPVEMSDEARILAERIAALEQSNQQAAHRESLRRREEATRMVDNAVGEFMNKHPDMSREQVGEIMDHAMGLGLAPNPKRNPLEVAYRDMHDFQAEIKEAEERGKKEALAGLQKRPNTMLEGSGAAHKAPPKLDYSKLSEDEQFDHMVKDLKEGFPD